MNEPWNLHFFQRHADDDRHQSVPARHFLDGLPDKVVAEILAVLDAVAEAPPPAFSGAASGRPCAVRWQGSTRSGYGERE